MQLKFKNRNLLIFNYVNSTNLSRVTKFSSVYIFTHQQCIDCTDIRYIDIRCIDNKVTEQITSA